MLFIQGDKKAVRFTFSHCSLAPLKFCSYVDYRGPPLPHKHCICGLAPLVRQQKNLAPAGRRLKIPVYPPVPAGSQVSTVRREHHNTELVQKELNTGRELTAKVALYSIHFECKGGIWHVERQI